MQAGKLDQRVTLWKLSGGTDAWGSPLPAELVAVGTVWARVQPLNGREYIAAQAAQSEVTARIRMRFRPWMTAQDRVIHNGTTYGIESLIDVRSDHRELVLMCKALG